MAADLVIKQHDAGKVVTGQFKDADGVAVNCSTNTSRKVLMRRMGITSTLKINSTFTFTDAATGTFSYTFIANDVDTTGTFLLEFETILAGPQTLTFPTDEDNPYIVVVIKKDLG